ncbi:MAG: hypothetical protein CMM93_02590 [Rickettsiales bacterium]|nr:hypothetical protein [Rickettsiales bacterium]|tara:strand:- start:793 stop:1374 length:582 start_codon:yes stop_codon:yes gene_type:complete
MKKLFLFFSIIVMPLTALADEAQVRQFADDLAQEALTVVKNDNLSEKGKQAELENLFSNRVDVEWVAQFVLGKYWRTASEEQKAAYLENYRKFVISHYSSKLTSYTNQDYKINDVRQESDDEYLVSMEVTQPGEPNVVMDYRVRQTGAGFKIYDIVVEGVSMITTQRSEFSSVISRNGLDYLIDALAKKAKKA